MALVRIPRCDRWTEAITLTADGAIITAANAATASGFAAATIKMVVHSLFLMAAGTETLTLDSGSTARTGVLPFVANTGMVLPESACGWFSTAAGEDLKINVTTGGVAVTGIVVVSFHP